MADFSSDSSWTQLFGQHSLHHAAAVSHVLVMWNHRNTANYTTHTVGPLTVILWDSPAAQPWHDPACLQCIARFGVNETLGRSPKRGCLFKRHNMKYWLCAWRISNVYLWTYISVFSTDTSKAEGQIVKGCVTLGGNPICHVQHGNNGI